MFDKKTLSDIKTGINFLTSFRAWCDDAMYQIGPETADLRLSLCGGRWGLERYSDSLGWHSLVLSGQEVTLLPLAGYDGKLTPVYQGDILARLEKVFDYDSPCSGYVLCLETVRYNDGTCCHHYEPHGVNWDLFTVVGNRFQHSAILDLDGKFFDDLPDLTFDALCGLLPDPEAASDLEAF